MQPETMAMVQPVASAEEMALRELENVVGQRRFDHWFREKTEFGVMDDELIVSVCNPFLSNWLQKHFRPALQQVAQTILGPAARLRFEVSAKLAAPQPQEQPARNSAPVPKVASPSAASKGKGPQDAPRDESGSHAPRPGRRFADLADFVAGPCNELALTAVRQVCERPGAQFNPLFIHGHVGTGKTHLLEAIYRQTRRRFPQLQVMYLTSEAFTNFFTQALREHSLPSFRQRFRTVDVLLIDDIDFLDSKRGIQEEFLHTFKQLESHGRQIVLSSDLHPRLLTKVNDELKTRFLSGLVCRLETPDYETRREIVERKAARLSADFSSEALTFVAERFKNNVRELEGALHSLQTYHVMTSKRISPLVARTVLADLERDCIKVVRLSDIEQAVCGLFGIQAEELKSAKRSRSLSEPRMLAMYLSRKHTRAAYSEIGEYFGGRNHSTVMSAERKIHDSLARSATIQVVAQPWPLEDVVANLEQQLQAG